MTVLMLLCLQKLDRGRATPRRARKDLFAIAVSISRRMISSLESGRFAFTSRAIHRGMRSRNSFDTSSGKYDCLKNQRSPRGHAQFQLSPANIALTEKMEALRECSS